MDTTINQESRKVRYCKVNNYRKLSYFSYIFLKICDTKSELCQNKQTVRIQPGMKSEYINKQENMRTLITENTNGQHVVHHNNNTNNHQASVTKCAQKNTNNVNNPGAGGLFDEALIRQVNLAAAFHDHISCTKLPSELSKAGGLFGFGGSPMDGCGLFGSPYSSNNEDKEQINMLKEMILVQLDLIQHQQEQLLKKDRQLQGKGLFALKYRVF